MSNTVKSPILIIIGYSYIEQRRVVYTGEQYGGACWQYLQGSRRRFFACHLKDKSTVSMWLTNKPKYQTDNEEINSYFCGKILLWRLLNRKSNNKIISHGTLGLIYDFPIPIKYPYSEKYAFFKQTPWFQRKLKLWFVIYALL